MTNTEGCHPSHETRISDASSFDEICTKCGATDGIGTWGKLAEPCPLTTPNTEGEKPVEVEQFARKVSSLSAELSNAVFCSKGTLSKRVRRALDELARLTHQPDTAAQPVAEPFGYWVEQKHAEPVLLRKPAYIPEPSPLRTVTPLYAQPASQPVGDVEQLREALKAARNILANSNAESGYCMCGDPIAGHNFGSGHAPVDSHVYVASQVIEQIDAALSQHPDPQSQGDVVERQKIVAWLRSDAATLNESKEPRDWKLAEAIDECADAIEQGQHARRDQAVPQRGPELPSES